jgi:hypothetical protein
VKKDVISYLHQIRTSSAYNSKNHIGGIKWVKNKKQQ